MNNLIEIRLLISSGDSPIECRRAVSLVVKNAERKAKDLRVQFDMGPPDLTSAGIAERGATLHPFITFKNPREKGRK